MPRMTRDKKGTSRDKTGTAGTKRDGRDNTGTSWEKTGTVMGKASKTKVIDYS